MGKFLDIEIYNKRIVENHFSTMNDSIQNISLLYNNSVNPPPVIVYNQKNKKNENISKTSCWSLRKTYSISPTHIVKQTKWLFNGEKVNNYNDKSLLNLDKNKTKVDLSLQSSRKLKNVLNWLVVGAKRKTVYSKSNNKSFYFYVNFITLTIPFSEKNKIEDKKAMKMLHNWLSSASYSFGLKNYVWKAETTENGQLHFHITSDTFIDYKLLRKSWNRILSKNGLLLEFYKKYGHIDANSTDVHSVKDVNSISSYLASYLTGKKKKAKKNIDGSFSVPSNQLIEDINGVFWVVKDNTKPALLNDNGLPSIGSSNCVLSKNNVWFECCSKQENRRVLSSRHWGCNYLLSIASNCSLHTDSLFFEEIEGSINHEKVWKKTIETPKDINGNSFKVADVWLLNVNQWGVDVTGCLYEAFSSSKYSLTNPSQLTFFESD